MIKNVKPIECCGEKHGRCSILGIDDEQMGQSGCRGGARAHRLTQREWSIPT